MCKECNCQGTMHPYGIGGSAVYKPANATVPTPKKMSKDEDD